MDENVIFTKSNQPAAPAPQPVQPPVAASPVQPYTPDPPVSPTPPAPPVQPAPQPIVPASSDSDLPKPPPLSFLSGKIPLIIGGIVLLLLIVVGIFFFTRPKSEKTSGKVALTYWGLFEDPQVMDSLIRDFQAANPNITVTYVKKDIQDYRKGLVTQISNGTGPDIYRFHNSWTGMMKDYLSPLSDSVISPDDFKKNYFPVVQQDMVRSGALYGLPLGVDTLALFINTEMFSASGYSVPSTWDQFVQVAKNSTVKEQGGAIKTSGAAIGTFDNVSHAPDLIALLMAQNGTNFSDFGKTQEAASQAIEFYKSFASGDDQVWNQSQDPSLTAFAKGNVAMYFGYSWDVFSIKAINPDLKFSVHPTPNLPDRKLSIASYWAEGVSLKSKHQKEAMLFMQYLAKKETLQKFYTEVSKTRLFGEPYPRSDLSSQLLSNELTAPFVEQAPYATSSYFASDTNDDGINAQMNGYLGNAIRGNESAKTATETLAQGVQQVLQIYGR